ncbi:MAG: SRPBCC family protein [Myxococcales bacterium]|nr:SRPBCC family protein [Myxococcales bacterium]
MKPLRVAFGMLVSLVLLLLVIGFFLPTDYHVTRSRTVRASCEEAYAVVEDLETYGYWMPWLEKDPTAKIVVGEPSRGEGARYRWTSEKVGSGAYVIRKAEPYARVLAEIDFGEMGKSEVYFVFEGDGATCDVVWGFRGEGQGPRPLAGWFATLMDAMVGRDFERGLARIASLAENEDT